MLDFEKLDSALEAAVGIAPDALLRADAPRWADRFFLARERLSELSEHAQVPNADALERDRLASFFGCAYGDHGFLARAGTLHTLRARLFTLGDSLPQLAQEPHAVSALRREGSILRALAQHRLSRPPHPDDAPLHARLNDLDDALGNLHDFAFSAMQTQRAHGVTRRGARLYAVSDLVSVANNFRTGLELPGLLAFVVGRLANRASTKEARTVISDLCEQHAGKLRDALWAEALVSLEQRGPPASLLELRELDLALEALRGELSNSQRAESDRIDAVSALYALLALGRTTSAERLAANMLDGALLLIAEGLAAETKGARR